MLANICLLVCFSLCLPNIALGKSKPDYSRLADRFIVNKGEVNELIRIHMDGKKSETNSEEKEKEPKEIQKDSKEEDKKEATKQPVQLTKISQEENPTTTDIMVGGYSATVTGPGKLSFNWRISCLPGAYMEVTLDGFQVKKLTGEIEWNVQSIQIPSGVHVVNWVCRKSEDCDDGDNFGWLDSAEFTPDSK